MSALSYDERILIIKKFLAEFYASFEVPREWSPEKLVKDIEETSELLNSEIVSEVNEGYRKYLLDEMSASVIKLMKARRLPAAGILIDALTKIKACKAPSELMPSTSLDHSREGIEARRMKMGLGVSEDVIFGAMGTKLVETNAISQEVLDQYRKTFLKAMQELYGKERGLEVLRERHQNFIW